MNPMAKILNARPDKELRTATDEELMRMEVDHPHIDFEDLDHYEHGKYYSQWAGKFITAHVVSAYVWLFLVIFQVLTAAQFRRAPAIADKLRRLHRIAGKVIGGPIAALMVALALLSVIQSNNHSGPGLAMAFTVTLLQALFITCNLIFGIYAVLRKKRNVSLHKDFMYCAIIWSLQPGLDRFYIVILQCAYTSNNPGALIVFAGSFIGTAAMLLGFLVSGYKAGTLRTRCMLMNIFAAGVFLIVYGAGTVYSLLP